MVATHSPRATPSTRRVGLHSAGRGSLKTSGVTWPAFCGMAAAGAVLVGLVFKLLFELFSDASWLFITHAQASKVAALVRAILVMIFMEFNLVQIHLKSKQILDLIAKLLA